MSLASVSLSLLLKKFLWAGGKDTSINSKTWAQNGGKRAPSPACDGQEGMVTRNRLTAVWEQRKNKIPDCGEEPHLWNNLKQLVRKRADTGLSSASLPKQPPPGILIKRNEPHTLAPRRRRGFMVKYERKGSLPKFRRAGECQFGAQRTYLVLELSSNPPDNQTGGAIVPGRWWWWDIHLSLCETAWTPLKPSYERLEKQEKRI